MKKKKYWKWSNGDIFIRNIVNKCCLTQKRFPLKIRICIDVHINTEFLIQSLWSILFFGCSTIESVHDTISENGQFIELIEYDPVCAYESIIKVPRMNLFMFLSFSCRRSSCSRMSPGHLLNVLYFTFCWSQKSSTRVGHSEFMWKNKIADTKYSQKGSNHSRVSKKLVIFSNLIL